MPEDRETEPVDPLTQAIFAMIGESERQPRPLHRMLARAPKVLESHYRLAMTLRHETALDRSVAEIAILRTALLEGANYAYRAHLGHARDAGVSPRQIAELTDWRESDAFDAREKAVLCFVDALADREVVAETLRADLRDYLDDAQIVELVAIVGFYAATARIACGLGLTDE